MLHCSSCLKRGKQLRLEQADKQEHASRHQPAPAWPHKTVPQAVAWDPRQVKQVQSGLSALLCVFCTVEKCRLQLHGRTRHMEQVQSLSSSLPMDGALWRVLGWTDSAWR